MNQQPPFSLRTARRLAASAAVAMVLPFLLTACPGKETESHGPAANAGTTPPATSLANMTVHKVELGLISEATVSVYSLKSRTLLYQVKTDKTGAFSLDTEAIKNKRASLNDAYPYVWVEATGGTDLDPNDDGKQEPGEAVPLSGSVTSVVPLARLLSENGFRFNLITSAVADLLKNSDDVNEERISQLGEQLVIPDMNQDGKYDSTDVLRYQMGTLSDGEARLRRFYLTSIHENNAAIRETSIEILKGNLKTVRAEKKQAGSSVELILYPLDRNSIIFYGNGRGTKPTSMLPLKYSPAQKITVPAGNGISFQECKTADIASCNARQSYTNDGGKPLIYLPDPKVASNPYTDPAKIKEIMANAEKTADAYLSAKQEYEYARRMADYYLSDAQDKQREIDALDAQLLLLQRR